MFYSTSVKGLRIYIDSVMDFSPFQTHLIAIASLTGCRTMLVSYSLEPATIQFRLRHLQEIYVTTKDACVSVLPNNF